MNKKQSKPPASSKEDAIQRVDGAVAKAARAAGVGRKQVPRAMQRYAEHVRTLMPTASLPGERPKQPHPDLEKANADIPGHAREHFEKLIRDEPHEFLDEKESAEKKKRDLDESWRAISSAFENMTPAMGPKT